MKSTSIFSTFSLNKRLLANRLVLAPMTRVSANADGTVGPLMQDYYTSFANGGFSMLITEGLFTDEQFSQGYQYQPGLATGTHAASWLDTVQAVKASGSTFIAQLMHAGALSQFNAQRDGTMAPSKVKPKGEQLGFYYGDGEFAVPDAMSQADIDSAIQGFIDSAVHAHKAGFDGVEIHGANGYLLDQFLTTYTNQRDDEYGGSIANRVRLIKEVIAGIRNAVPADFIVGVRLSQAKVNDPDYQWGSKQDAEVIFNTVEQAGVDYVHITEPDLTREVFDGPASLGQLAKQTVAVPVIINGGVSEQQHASSAIDEAHGDLVAIGKAALGDHAWPQKVREGQQPAEFDFAMLTPIADIDNERTYKANH